MISSNAVPRVARRSEIGVGRPRGRTSDSRPAADTDGPKAEQTAQSEQQPSDAAIDRSEHTETRIPAMNLIEKELSTDFVPASFAERGVAVPFTTPLLAQARVRVDPSNRAEFILANLSGGKGRYVMPWKTLQGLATVTLHDRALFERLNPKVVRKPGGIRLAAITVAAKGFAGPRAAAAAQRTLAAEQQYGILTHFYLIVRLLRMVNLALSQSVEEVVREPKAQRAARVALTEAARALGVPQKDMLARIEALSSLVAPVGVADAPERGVLARQATDVEDLQRSLRAWALDQKSEVADLATYSGQLAEVTSKLCRGCIADIDRKLDDLPSVFKNWKNRIGDIEKSLTRLHYLLDGWDYIATLWRSTVDKEFHECATAAAEVYRVLPLLPKSEAKVVSDEQIVDMNAVQRRWVRANEDWRTGRLDFGMVKRIEAIKAKMA